ncbi:MAG: hypothetical protein ABI794_17580 [Betaproteobacteria bacterium]
MIGFLRIALLSSMLGSVPLLAQAAQKLTPFDATTPAALKQTYAGKPFVLVFWSVACAPCLVDMAQWRNFGRKYPGVIIVHVATESLEDSAAIEAALERHDPGASDQRAFADDFPERIRFAMDPSWRGETPRAYFFDRKHERITRSGALDVDWTRRWFEQQTAPMP